MVMKKYETGKMAEMLFSDRCSVMRYEFEADERGVSIPRLTDVYENIKCRISYSLDGPNRETKTVSEIKHKIKVYFPSRYEIKSGDVLTVVRGTVQECCKACSKSRRYLSHQEIEAEIMDKNP